MKKIRSHGHRLQRLRRLPKPGVWLARHAQMALSTLGDLVRNPQGSALTILVIGIALALPAGLLLLLQQIEGLAGHWEQTTSISVFLSQDAEDEQALQLAASLEERSDVAAVTLLTRDDAMREFREYSGFGDILDALETNPLPPVLLVQPRDADPAALEPLVETLRALPQQDFVQFDYRWLSRFRAMAAIGQRAAAVFAASLGLAVLLIVGNTIRLEIQNRRPEIEINKLVGATDAFIRRPFLYRGLWFGILGGVAAWIFAGTALSALAGPAATLADQYGSTFRLIAWHPLALVMLTTAGIFLGLGGAWLAVGRHLSAIKPS